MKRSTVVAGIALGFGLITSVYFLPTVSSEGSIDAATVAETLVDRTNIVRVSNSMNDTTAQIDSVLAYDASKFIKPSDSVLKERLSGIEYKVTQKDGTERPFSNSLHEEKRTGLYVDIVSGEPLFSSSDKFDSGTGWPSFVRPLAAGVVVEKEDRSLFGLRTEIRSAVADSHLGHVFADGPAPTGNRYCMNAAAMRFIPLEDMLENGYGDYIERVTTTSS